MTAGLHNNVCKVQMQLDMFMYVSFRCKGHTNFVLSALISMFVDTVGFLVFGFVVII